MSETEYDLPYTGSAATDNLYLALKLSEKKLYVTVPDEEAAVGDFQVNGVWLREVK